MRPVFVITPGDMIGFAFFALFASVIVYTALKTRIRQMRCKHDGGVNETSSCAAICRKCGKELGFIDDWRKPE